MDYFTSDPIKVFLPVNTGAAREHHAPFKDEGEHHPAVVLYSEPTGGGIATIRDLVTYHEDKGTDDVPRLASLVRRRIAVQAWKLVGDWRIYSHSWGEESPQLPDMTAPGALEEREALVSRLPESHQMAIMHALEGTDTVEEAAKKD